MVTGRANILGWVGGFYFLAHGTLESWDAYREKGVREMPIGKNRGALDKVKNYSLDYILRTRYARQAGTMQAVDSVLESLEATGLFLRSKMLDPVTAVEVDSMKLA